MALAAPASACDTVDVEVEGVEVDVDCSYGYDDDEDEDDDGPPSAQVDGGRAHDDELLIQYGMQFLPYTPGHDISVRYVGEHATYIGGELRYVPASDLLWSGRVGAGLDVFPNSDLD